MAIKSSGSLSFVDIWNEFGGPVPASLGSYYRGGSLVPNGPAENNNIPTSGTIRFSNFYGASNVFNATFTGNFAIMDLRSELVNRGWNQSAPVRAYFAPGTIVRSYSPDYAALNIGGSFPNGIKVVIDGAAIVGCGGFGGNGAGYNPNTSTKAGTVGGSGGPALLVGTANVTIENLGWILGGGGGGGGGAAGYVSVYTDKSNYNVYMSGGGGGGGMDWVYSLYGSAGTVPSFSGHPGDNGGSGSSASPGSGGLGGSYNGSARAGNGGNGGSWGAAGSAGTDTINGVYRHIASTSGGAGGSAVLGNRYITWISYGTRLGAIEW